MNKRLSKEHLGVIEQDPDVGDVPKLMGHIDALVAENAHLRQQVEALVEALEKIGKYENVDVLGSHDVYLDYAARIANEAIANARRRGKNRRCH